MLWSPIDTLTSHRDGLSGADEVRGLGGDATDAEIRVTSSSQRKLLGETERSYATVGKPVAENAERIGCSSIQREVTAIEGPDGARDKLKYEVDAIAGGSVLPVTGPRTVTCGDSSMVSLLLSLRTSSPRIVSSTSVRMASPREVYSLSERERHQHVRRTRRHTIKRQGQCVCVQAQRLCATLEQTTSKISLLQPE